MKIISGGVTYTIPVSGGSDVFELTTVTFEVETEGAGTMYFDNFMFGMSN